MTLDFSEGSIRAVRFPSDGHRVALLGTIERFERDPDVKALVLLNSFARNEGDSESDLDLAIFVAPDDVTKYKASAREFVDSLPPEPTVHLAATSLNFTPGPIHTEAIDAFEIRIGNFLAYPVPLFDRSGEWTAARDKFLPYYDETLAQERFQAWRKEACNQAHSAHTALRRELRIEIVDRIFRGLKLFFAALFCKHRTYPVDYVKRVERHVTEWLMMPNTTDQAVEVLHFDANDLNSLSASVHRLESLIQSYL